MSTNVLSAVKCPTSALEGRRADTAALGLQLRKQHSKSGHCFKVTWPEPGSLHTFFFCTVLGRYLRFFGKAGEHLASFLGFKLWYLSENLQAPSLGLSEVRRSEKVKQLHQAFRHQTPSFQIKGEMETVGNPLGMNKSGRHSAFPEF